MIQDGQLLNYIGGKWQRSRATEFLDVRNPATAETMVCVPLTPSAEVDEEQHGNYSHSKRTLFLGST